PASVAAVTERTVRDLKTLLQICTEINSTRGHTALQRRLLELIFEAVPADSGAILFSADSHEPAPSLGWSRRSGMNSTVTVSRSVIQKVFQNRSAIMSNDIANDAVIEKHPSLIQRQVHSVLAVPLLLFDKVTGVIYLEAKEPGVRFD